LARASWPPRSGLRGKRPATDVQRLLRRTHSPLTARRRTNNAATLAALLLISSSSLYSVVVCWAVVLRALTAAQRKAGEGGSGSAATGALHDDLTARREGHRYARPRTAPSRVASLFVR
jgi:hypothetical protein